MLKCFIRAAASYAEMLITVAASCAEIFIRAAVLYDEVLIKATYAKMLCRNVY